MKKRNPAVVILLEIITCGIYELYWMVVTTNAIQDNLKNPDGSVRSGGTVILLSIVTCGIYMFYWWYKQGSRIHQLGKDFGVEVPNNSTLFLILCFFGVGLVINTVLLQSALNQIVDAKEKAPATSD